METTLRKDFNVYLQPTPFIDSQSSEIIRFAKEVSDGAGTAIDKAVNLYYAVRDGISYDPYRAKTTPAGLKASSVLKKKIGNCASKAILLAAVARAVRIPSRLGFADVRNHLTTDGLKRLLNSDVIRYHSYTELYLKNKWIKATPAFDRSLCQSYFNVDPLEFDGKNDSMLQEFDHAGGRFMVYIKDRGQFADFPYKQIKKTFERYYPHLASSTSLFVLRGDFQKEALSEKEKV